MRQFYIDEAIAVVESLKDECADEIDSLTGNVTAQTIHKVHQSTYLKVLTALEATRQGPSAAVGTPADRISNGLLDNLRLYVAGNSLDFLSEQSRTGRDIYELLSQDQWRRMLIDFIDWAQANVNSAAKTRAALLST